MSEFRVAALVCEGQTDVPVLKELVWKLWPEIGDVRVLQPELDEMGRVPTGGRAGWSEVKAWCDQNAADLDSLFQPLAGDPVDLLIVAMDMDVALEASIENPPRVAGAYEAPRLRATITSWLMSGAQAPLPAQIVVSTPVMAIEAWVIKALFRHATPERISNPAQFLVDKKKLRKSPNDGKPWKELHLYRQFAKVVASKIAAVRKGCKEAERTCRGIEGRRAALTTQG